MAGDKARVGGMVASGRFFGLPSVAASCVYMVQLMGKNYGFHAIQAKEKM